MSTVKKFLIFALIFSSIPLFCIDARAEKRICIFLSSGEGRYLDSQKGVVDQLADEDFKSPAVKYTVENAFGNKAKAAEVARKIKSEKPDLIIAVGTIAAVAVSKIVKDTPIVFTMVYDPVAAGIARDWQHSGNNTTGASNMGTNGLLVSSLQAFAQVKTLAVLYTPGQQNSEAELVDLQKSSSQLRIIPVILANKNDVNLKVPGVLRKANALYLTGSSIVDAAVPIIVDMATKAKVITVTHLEDIVKKGALLGICSNPYSVGRLSGKKAGNILKGAKPSLIPIERLTQLAKMDVIVNMNPAKKGDFQIPASFAAKITKTIE